MEYAEKLLIQQEAKRYSVDCSRGADLKWKFDSSKKQPLYGLLKHSFPQFMSKLDLDGYGWQWKNLILFSIIWIGFRWCESRDSLNFLIFSGGFFGGASHQPIHWHPHVLLY